MFGGLSRAVFPRSSLMRQGQALQRWALCQMQRMHSGKLFSCLCSTLACFRRAPLPGVTDFWMLLLPLLHMLLLHPLLLLHWYPFASAAVTTETVAVSFETPLLNPCSCPVAFESLHPLHAPQALPGHLHERACYAQTCQLSFFADGSSQLDRGVVTAGLAGECCCLGHLAQARPCLPELQQQNAVQAF